MNSQKQDRNATAGQVIADLRRQLAERDAEIERLTGMTKAERLVTKYIASKNPKLASLAEDLAADKLQQMSNDELLAHLIERLPAIRDALTLLEEQRVKIEQLKNRQDGGLDG